MLMCIDMKAYTVSDKEKLGNAIVYVANHVPDLSKTKLFKLLYFMEVHSVKRFHTPLGGKNGWRVPYWKDSLARCLAELGGGV